MLADEASAPELLELFVTSEMVKVLTTLLDGAGGTD